MFRSPRVAIIGLLALAGQIAGANLALAQGPLDPEPFLRSWIPTAAVWSRDGESIAYLRSGYTGRDVTVYSVVEGKETVVYSYEKQDVDVDLTRVTGRYYAGPPPIRWTTDDDRVLFLEGKEVVSVAPRGGKPDTVFSAATLGELVELSPDARHISFIQQGDIWVQPLAGGKPRRLTQNQRFLVSEGSDRFARLLQWPLWSPDSRKISFLSPMANGWRVGIASVDGTGTAWIVPHEDIAGLTVVQWSPDSRHLAISRLNSDFQRKELMVAPASGDWVRTIWTDSDDRWVDHNINPGFGVSWAPNGERLAFLSNRSGWRHVYLADINGDAVRSVTDGEYDVYSVRWLPDGQHLIVTSNRGHWQQRHPWRVSVADGEAVRLTSEPGVYHIQDLSPDGSRLALTANLPGSLPSLVITDATAAGDKKVLASAKTQGLSETDVANVEAVSFPSKDGTTVHAVLITPKGMRRDGRHPALVNMYGGWGQRAQLQGASAYHNYLTANGIVVLIVDPRGSEGYGEEFAKGLYRDAGGKQSEDLVAAAAFLRTLPFIDPAGVGIHGHSFSGWLTMWTLIHSPDAFNAGIAGAQSGWARADIGQMYSTYWSIRLGLPHQPDHLLEERNPILHAERVKAPVLIVHGTKDINVPIAASERMVKALIAAKKDFEYMVYPGEPHGWTRFDTNVDFYRRTVRFLNRHLRHDQDRQHSGH